VHAETVDIVVVAVVVVDAELVEEAAVWSPAVEPRLLLVAGPVVGVVAIPAPPLAVVDDDVITVVISGPVVNVRAWVRLWLPSPAVDVTSTNGDDVTMRVVVVVVAAAAEEEEVVEVECDEDEVDDEDDGVELAVVVVEAAAVPSSTVKPPLAVVDAVEFVAAVISAPVVKVTPMVDT
jgi:hypothetical protein